MSQARKLRIPARCSIFVAWMRQCEQSAYWLVNGQVVCDEHIRWMADMNTEHEEFLRPALDDMASSRRGCGNLLSDGRTAIENG